MTWVSRVERTYSVHKVNAMSVAAKPMTTEEYLNYDDGTDTHYELVNGKLIDIPTESDLNDCIVTFLFAYFLQIGVLYV